MKKHYVSNEAESIRLFKLDWMNALSKVHWTTPVIIYLPFISFLVYQTTVNQTISFLGGLGYFFGGMIAWTISEYLLHRFLFHYQPASKIGKRIIFLFHGVHHDYPNDPKRLVMPPAASIPLATLFYLLFKVLIPSIGLLPFFAGFLTGYLIYDMIHYATHHAAIKGGKLWMAIKSHHLKHHFKDPKKGFGVSSPIWDRFFKTDYLSKS